MTADSRESYLPRAQPCNEVEPVLIVHVSVKKIEFRRSAIAPEIVTAADSSDEKLQVPQDEMSIIAWQLLATLQSKPSARQKSALSPAAVVFFGGNGEITEFVWGSILECK